MKKYGLAMIVAFVSSVVTSVVMNYQMAKDCRLAYNATNALVEKNNTKKQSHCHSSEKNIFQPFEPDISSTLNFSKAEFTELGKDLPKILKAARMKLITNPDGEILGAQITNISPKGLAANWPIKEGDLLVGINDLKVNSAQALVQSFQLLRDRESNKFYLLRNKKKVVITVLTSG